MTIDQNQSLSKTTFALTVQVFKIALSLCCFKSNLSTSEDNSEKMWCHILPLCSFDKVSLDKLSDHVTDRALLHITKYVKH